MHSKAHFMSVSDQRILFITVSSRREGNTKQVMRYLSRCFDSELVDLADLNISYYDYDHENRGDDFLALAEKMTESSTIILGTPVYWYTMAAQMKTFLDRWSDLLTIRKDLGRRLKGKRLLLISCGSWEESGKGFDLPFQQTADYMDMAYAGHFHTWLTDKEVFGNDNVQKRVTLLQNSIKHIIGQ